MSVKMINKGASGKGNENVHRRNLRHQNTAQKPVVFHSVSKPSPSLSDRSEFPSLNESTGRATNNSNSTGGTLKYSDKLKTLSSSQNQKTLSENLHFRSDAVVTNIHNQLDDRTTRTKFQKFVNKDKTDGNSNQNIPKRLSEQSLKKSTSLNEAQRHSDNKNELTKQRLLVNSSANSKGISDKTSTFISNNANLFSKSNNQIQSNKSIKLSSENDESKEETDNIHGSSNATKKKKRKSKVKRQVAFQSGKITVLSPEVHFKILNQSSALTKQNFKSVLTDINDEDEYPELGKPVLPTSQKQNFLKKNISSEYQKETIDKPADPSAEKNHVITENITEESSESVISVEKSVIEKKGKGDTKEKIHSYDPITISFYDMLLDKNLKPKVKDFKNEADIPTTVGLTKIKKKKNTCHPHNLLDSSSPAIKRGKEREKPKLKRPSQLKKIILLDRKARREQLLQMKNNNEEENDKNDSELMHEAHADEDNETGTEKTNILGKTDFENDPSDQSDLDEDGNQALLLLTENTDLNLQDGLVPEMEHLNLSEVQEDYKTANDLSFISNEDIKLQDFTEKSTLNLSFNKIPKNEEHSHAASQTISKSATSTEMPLNVPRSSDSLLNSLIGNVKSTVSDKERAAKILLHTRNFREYCNHLISKDIDDVVFALLDDLARFQDRLHQKDPVKARMKRRLVYGVKEVRKHIKLRKLKCIIIAVDIENVEAQGGLNDVLNDIKTSAVDHHIPCVFALGRKVLGKVCHKPVPVSCVGVFNFEGSEANFKKMVELQTQSKADYAEIFNKLILKLTDEEASTLLKAKKEAPETLRTFRTDILNDFFLKSKTKEVENENTDLKPTEMSLIDS